MKNKKGLRKIVALSVVALLVLIVLNVLGKIDVSITLFILGSVLFVAIVKFVVYVGMKYFQMRAYAIQETEHVLKKCQFLINILEEKYRLWIDILEDESIGIKETKVEDVVTDLQNNAERISVNLRFIRNSYPFNKKQTRKLDAMLVTADAVFEDLRKKE